MKKKFLITGATGYIGFKLAKDLCQTCDISVLIRHQTPNRFRLASLEEKINIIEYTDYHDLESILKKNHFDGIFHLATTNRNGTWKNVIESNLVFSTHLVKFYVQHSPNPCFINTSPYSAYDSQGNYLPNTLYDASKKAFEDLLDFFCLQENLSVATLHIYDVYGLDDWRGKIFSLLLESVKNNVPLKLTEGKEFLNHVYISDVISAYKLTMKEICSTSYKNDGLHKRYYVASDETLTLKETVSIMERVFQKKAPVEWGAFAYPKGRMIAKPFLDGPKPSEWQAKHTLTKVLKTT